MNERPSHAWLAVQAAVSISLLLLGVVVNAYGVVTASGLWWLIAAVQIAFWGVYFPEITFALVVLGTVGELALLAWALRAARLWPRELFESPEAKQWWAEWSGWAGLRLRRLLLLVLSLGCIVFGGAFALTGWTAGERKAVKAADVEAGQRPQGWVEVEGVLRMEMRQEWTGDNPEVLVPVVSPDWQGGPVAVVLHAKNNAGLPAAVPGRAVELNVGRYEGMVAPLGVSGLQRSEFEKAGVHLADKAVLVDYKENPESLLNFGLVLLGVGAGGGVLVAVLWVLVALYRFARGQSPAF
jgi:hypothetical protein